MCWRIHTWPQLKHVQMCVCVCLYVYVSIYMYIYICKYIYVYIYVTFARAHMALMLTTLQHMSTCIYVNVYNTYKTYLQGMWVCACKKIFTNTDTYMCICLNIYTYKHTYIHTQPQTYINKWTRHMHTYMHLLNEFTRISYVHRNNP